MEMEEGSASAGDTVTMEISAAAPVERAEPEEPVQQRDGQRPARNYRMLIVIGEISSGRHLDAARQQITQGKAAQHRRPRPLRGSLRKQPVVAFVVHSFIEGFSVLPPVQKIRKCIVFVAVKLHIVFYA